MLPNIITGIVTGGFSFLKEWWGGKQEKAKQELKLKQESVRVENEIKLKQVQARLDEDTERVRQMASSWKDEAWMIVFMIPLVNMFVSPFVDLIYVGQYKEGMLAEAASEALLHLSNAPSWYVILIVIMVCLSWGYRKGIDTLLEVIRPKQK